jgi:hypothetical protein
LALDPAEKFELRTENSSTTVTVPFSPSPVWHLDREGLVWYGYGSTFRVARRTLENDTILLVERQHEPKAVLERERELALSFLEYFEEQGMMIDYSRIPTVMPAFDGLLSDDRGYLWAFAHETDLEHESPRAAVRAFHVFDEGGVYLGEVVTPLDISPLATPRVQGSFMYAVTMGEYDVPYVVRLRVEGRD